MLNLQWLGEGKVPTQEELSSLDSVITQAIVNMKEMHFVEGQTAFFALSILGLLMKVFEEGVRRVREAMRRAIEEDPILAFIMLLGH